jgi:cytochrome c6
MRLITVLAILCLAFVLACTSSESPTPTTTALKEDSGAKSGPSGASIYRNRCITCHGANGRMGNNGAKKLPESELNVAQRAEVVTHGRNIMPAFEDMLTPEEIQAVAEFTMTLK